MIFSSDISVAETTSSGKSENGAGSLSISFCLGQEKTTVRIPCLLQTSLPPCTESPQGCKPSLSAIPNHRMTDFFMVTSKTSFYRKFLTLRVNSVQCRGYIRLSGQTPGAYHTSSRPIAASCYLTETSRPVGEIADLLGDGGQSFFPAAFKKRYSVYPLAYRAQTAF